MICLNTEKLDLFIIICRILLYIWLQCTHMTILIIIVRKILMLAGNLLPRIKENNKFANSSFQS